MPPPEWPQPCSASRDSLDGLHANGSSLNGGSNLNGSGSGGGSYLNGSGSGGSRGGVLLGVHHQRLPAVLEKAGGSERLFWELFGACSTADTFWLDRWAWCIVVGACSEHHGRSVHGQRTTALGLQLVRAPLTMCGGSSMWHASVLVLTILLSCSFCPEKGAPYLVFLACTTEYAITESSQPQLELSLGTHFIIATWPHSLPLAQLLTTTESS